MAQDSTTQNGKEMLKNGGSLVVNCNRLTMRPKNLITWLDRTTFKLSITNLKFEIWLSIGGDILIVRKGVLCRF